MAFTRNWQKSRILDHSKFKEIPSYARSVMEDIEERLTAYLYGFATGETYGGTKKLTLITIPAGTGPGSGTIPTGTGVQSAINVQGETIDGKVELITIDADGNEIQLTSKGNRLRNNTWFKATNFAGTAGINIIKVNTANQIEIGTSFGTHLVGPDTGPTTALQYAPKGYVDNAINVKVGGGVDGTTIQINTGTNKLEVIKETTLGSWVDKSGGYDTQQAATDGFLLVLNAATVSILVYSDSSNPPTTVRGTASVTGNGERITITIPIKKNDYWKVTGASATVYWIPMGS